MHPISSAIDVVKIIKNSRFSANTAGSPESEDILDCSVFPLRIADIRSSGEIFTELVCMLRQTIGESNSSRNPVSENEKTVYISPDSGIKRMSASPTLSPLRLLFSKNALSGLPLCLIFSLNFCGRFMVQVGETLRERVVKKRTFLWAAVGEPTPTKLDWSKPPTIA